ncbi:putative transmembrane protein [Toxoplasma gondii VAND]|uniref:Putative transmembrane protein n=1 Tax=Toxoplasma gondii VAND TaxID=933077 RepID=A0A086QJI3_TOXGO|nr:putative transmembrane protein [Toxoplasma gondii VAND]
MANGENFPSEGPDAAAAVRCGRQSASKPTRSKTVYSEMSLARQNVEVTDPRLRKGSLFLGRQPPRCPPSAPPSPLLVHHVVVSLFLVSAAHNLFPLFDSRIVAASAESAYPRDPPRSAPPPFPSAFHMGSNEWQNPFQMAALRPAAERAAPASGETPFFTTLASRVATRDAFPRNLPHEEQVYGNNLSGVADAPPAPPAFRLADERSQALLGQPLGRRTAAANSELESHVSPSATGAPVRFRHQWQNSEAPNAMSFINWQMLGATMTHPALQVTGSPLAAPPVVFHQPDPALAMSQHGKIIAVAAACMVVSLVILLLCCFMVRRKRAHEAYMARPLTLPNQA